MQRCYPQRINWENEPSTDTPLDEDNLNLMDAALYEIDGRVVDHDNDIQRLEGYETAAAQSAQESAASATASASSATASEGYADDAHGWADNKGDSGSDEYSATNNAYYYMMEARRAASGGHTIVNPSGTDMTQRARLQFTGNVTVSDNSAGGKTIVDVKGNPEGVYDSYQDMIDDWANIEVGSTLYVKEDDHIVMDARQVALNNSNLASVTGNSDISAIGDGTLTGAILGINSDLSELHHSDYGLSVNLKNYTSYDSAYVCPCDGYVKLNLGTTAPLTAAIYVNGSIMLSSRNDSNYTVMALFVRKGMKVHVKDVSTSAAVSFIPIA